MVYIKCSDVAAKVSDIIDGQDSLVMRIGFYGHLMICKNCCRYFEQFKKVKKLAGKVNSDDLPPDFDRVMGFVMDEIEKDDKLKKQVM